MAIKAKAFKRTEPEYSPPSSNLLARTRAGTMPASRRKAKDTPMKRMAKMKNTGTLYPRTRKIPVAIASAMRASAKRLPA